MEMLTIHNSLYMYNFHHKYLNILFSIHTYDDCGRNNYFDYITITIAIFIYKNI